MEEIAALLGRIALALEEQNRLESAWIETNKIWHEQNEANDIGPRVLAYHEQSAVRDQEYRAHMRRVTEEQARMTDEIIQASYEAYLASLKSPSRELVQAIQNALGAQATDGQEIARAKGTIL